MIKQIIILASCVAFVLTACPPIVSRAQWGARRTYDNTPLRVNPPTYVVVHHSDTPACNTPAECKARIRNIQNYHMSNNGWSDIGYHFLIGGDGNIYEGRGWGKFGIHCPKYNGNSIGVCLIGNFMNKKPSAAQLNALRRLISCGVGLHKINPQYGLVGHRQGFATACPGNALFNEISHWPHFRRSG